MSNSDPQLFVVVILYCVQLLSEVIFFNNSFYLFPLLKLFSFTWLHSSWNQNQKVFPQDELQPKIKLKRIDPKIV